MEKELLVELDERQSGNISYRLVCHLGSKTLAIIANGPKLVRIIEIPSDSGLDALAHPESYLCSENVIFGDADV